MIAEFGFSKTNITDMLSAWSIAHVRASRPASFDRTRKIIMSSAPLESIIVNLVCPPRSWNVFHLRADLADERLVSTLGARHGRDQCGVVQPHERALRRHFRVHDPSGQFAINLAPLILAGFSVGTGWPPVTALAFRIPPRLAAMAILLVLIPTRHRGEGFRVVATGRRPDEGVGSFRESFVTIFTHPLVWFYAGGPHGAVQ
jgi:hypothetical protein